MDDDLSSGNKLRIPTAARGRHSIHEDGTRERQREERSAREGREGLEKSDGIHSYDRRRRRRRRLCIPTHVHIHMYAWSEREGGRFINFWDSRWNPEALKRGADLSPDPSPRNRFRWVALFTFCFFPPFFDILFFSACYAPAGNLINRELFVTPAAGQV